MTGDPATRGGRFAADKAAQPPRGADANGAIGGAASGDAAHGGLPIAASSSGHATSGTNAQSGQPSAGESERVAPGISTEKKSDDTK